MRPTRIKTVDDWKAFWKELETSWGEISVLPLMEGWFEELEVIHHGYFNSESGPDGSGWKPLAQSTIDRKGHDTILYDTERLVRSLIEGGGDAIRELGGGDELTTLSFGTAVPYSIYHNAQTGREHIGINGDHLDKFTAATADHALAEWR